MELGEREFPVICACQGDFMLWDATDVIKLREKHRIIGVCSGSLPWKPRQNSQGGLPLRLSKVEAAFLVTRGLALLRDSSNVPQEIYDSGRKGEVEELRVAQRRTQIKLLREQKAAELDVMSESILLAKKVKRRKIMSKEISQTEMSEADDFEKFKETELEKTSSLKLDQTWIKMDVASKSIENFPILYDFDFNFSKNESLHFDVFSDLHDQGFYMTNGNKFGGDFLVYPGDPVAYHSFYIAVCIPHRKQLHGHEYSAYGRLASTVRKTLLLCSKAEDGEIKYLSMSWTGIAPHDMLHSPSKV